MQRQLAESEATLEEQAAQIADQKKLVDEATKILGPGVTLDNLKEKIDQIEQQKKDQTKKLEELTTRRWSHQRCCEKQGIDCRSLRP